MKYCIRSPNKRQEGTFGKMNLLKIKIKLYQNLLYQKNWKVKRVFNKISIGGHIMISKKRFAEIEAELKDIQKGCSARVYNIEEIVQIIEEAE